MGFAFFVLFVANNYLPMKIRTLIVDDEPKLCACLKSYFTAKGLTVSTVSEGERAIDRLTREAPDVILLDWMLPGESGLALARRAGVPLTMLHVPAAPPPSPRRRARPGRTRPAGRPAWVACRLAA